MAAANCPSCKNRIFEAQVQPVANAQPHIFIVCSKCGHILGIGRGGVFDQQVMKISNAIKAIAAKQGVTVDLDS